MIARFSRSALRYWYRTRIAPGYAYQVMEAFGPHLSGGGPLPARLPTGATVPCDLRDHVQRHIYFGGCYEPVESYLFTRLIRPGDTVVDAGANIGQYTLLASAAAGPAGSVHAFEPVPKNFARLSAAAAANGAANAVLNPAGLWHEAGVIALGLADEFRGNNDGSFSVGVAGDVTAPAVRFDDYATLHHLGRVAVVKMDIEGAEWSALRGMEGVLGRDRPVLIAEVNRVACERVGYDPDVFWQLLVRGLGYTAWRIGGAASEWRPLESAAGVTQANVLFAPGPLPDAVTGGWTTKSCMKWAAGL